MASEERRGCGYRKVGGLYLVGPKPSESCTKLPVELEVCPTCTGGIKQTRGWTWVSAKAILQTQECREQGVRSGAVLASGALAVARHRHCEFCPLGGAIDLLGDKCGLLWIGGKFYPEPEDWHQEANRLGVSRRIAALPKGFKLGEHWVLIAHPRAVKRKPRTREEEAELTEANKARAQDHLPLDLFLARKGVISVFRPTAIEKIVTQSQAEDSAEMDALRRRGITPVVVPDDDKDHQGSVFDVSEAE